MVCLKDTTYIYSLKDLSLYSKFQTYPNTKGICTLEVSNNEPIIITLGKHKGTIRISVYHLFQTNFIDSVENEKKRSFEHTRA